MAYDKQQAQHEFTRWSESYDRGILQWLLFGPSHRALIKRIKAVAADRPIKILDIGCGTGILAAKLRDSLPLCKVWGIDLNAEMLGQGRERWQRNAAHVQAVQGDSEQLPFDADVFDFVTCANSFHHYPNQAKAVAEMNRVLKPGGKLLVLEFSTVAEPLRKPYDWYSFKVLPRLGKLVAGDDASYRYLAESIRMHPDQETLKTMMQQGGFGHVDYHNLTGGIAALHVAIKC